MRWAYLSVLVSFGLAGCGPSPAAPEAAAPSAETTLRPESEKAAAREKNVDATDTPDAPDNFAPVRIEKNEEEEARIDRIDFLTEAQARARWTELRYYPPTSIPYPDGSRERDQYLKGYRFGWNEMILRVRLEEDTLAGVSIYAPRDAKRPLTIGRYAGQRDGALFVNVLAPRLLTDRGTQRDFLRLQRRIRANPVPPPPGGWRTVYMGSCCPEGK